MTAPSPDPDLAGRRVLVVEDEMLVAMLVEDILAQLGCTVVGPAARIAEALPMARSEALDCAFLDVNVAGERVFPVAAALAERRVPFVVPTASYGNPLDGGRVAMAYLDLERTVDGLGVDGPAWRALLGPLVREADAVAQFTLSELLQVPRHPLVAARFGLTALAQGGPWWDLQFRTEAPGALLSGAY